MTDLRTVEELEEYLEWVQKQLKCPSISDGEEHYLGVLEYNIEGYIEATKALEQKDKQIEELVKSQLVWFDPKEKRPDIDRCFVFYADDCLYFEQISDLYSKDVIEAIFNRCAFWAYINKPTQEG